MKKSFLVTALLLTALAGASTLLPTLANASPGRAGQGPGDGPRLHRMAQALGLSTEQQARIQEIIKEEGPALAPLQETLRTSREALHKAITIEPFDETAVRALASDQAATRTEMIVARARMQNRIQAVLTPEQRVLAEKLRAEHREGHGPRGRHGEGWEPQQ